MCNYCCCENMDKCSIVGFMPNGHCCEKCDHRNGGCDGVKEALETITPKEGIRVPRGSLFCDEHNRPMYYIKHKQRWVCLDCQEKLIRDWINMYKYCEVIDNHDI